MLKLSMPTTLPPKPPWCIKPCCSQPFNAGLYFEHFCISWFATDDVASCDIRWLDITYCHMALHHVTLNDMTLDTPRLFGHSVTSLVLTLPFVRLIRCHSDVTSSGHWRHFLDCSRHKNILLWLTSAALLCVETCELCWDHINGQSRGPSTIAI